jgi:hypothetical protein
MSTWTLENKYDGSNKAGKMPVINPSEIEVVVSTGNVFLCSWRFFSQTEITNVLLLTDRQPR